MRTLAPACPHFQAERTAFKLHFENDFPPLMRCAGEHLVSSAHIVQREDGAYMRDQLPTIKQL